MGPNARRGQANEHPQNPEALAWFARSPGAPGVRTILVMATHATETTTAFDNLTIRDVMHTGVLTCAPDDDLAAVARTMVTHRIHAVVIERANGSGPMFVTDLELVRAALRAGNARAGDLARDPAPSLPADAPLRQAVATMGDLDIAHVLAVDSGSGVPCGVISSLDVAAALGGDRLSRGRPRNPASPHLHGQTLCEARVGDVMRPSVVTCAPDTEVQIVARCMVEHHVHCVAVAGVPSSGPHSRHYGWGLVSDMEIVHAVHGNALTESAASIAASAPAAVNEDDTVAVAAGLMVDDDTSHVVVVGPAGLPCGTISTLDVARILAAV
jgi:CBS domain-containing protein